jgi:choline dehydrogenase-like flavoprotein
MDHYYYGRRPTQPMIPNFRNIQKQEMDFLRGYMIFFGADRPRAYAEGLGADFKDSISEPGTWTLGMSIQGETIPKETNHVRLSKDKKDKWGMPLLVTSVDYDDNDEKLLKDFFITATEMMQAAGCTNIQTTDTKQAPGLDIHEVGGVRMGNDPKTSLLNKWNAMHHCPNVFVTDGACMTSTGVQNPSLTFMALTARAVDHAVGELKKGA